MQALNHSKLKYLLQALRAGTDAPWAEAVGRGDLQEPALESPGENGEASLLHYTSSPQGTATCDTCLPNTH
jgi:hypothetical protein